MQRNFVKEYSDVKLSFTKQDYRQIEAFFMENSDGFITSKIDNSFLRGENIMRMFRPLRIFSAIAVPIYNNERLNSIFFAFNCVGDSYKVCMRKNRINLTELDTYRFIFRQIVEANEKHVLNEQLKQQVYNAEKANRAKSDFLARMSHEIRTPINAVLGMNELILRESQEDEIKHYASDIRNSANNLLSIINEILDSAKIESGKMEIVCARYQMSEFLNNLYNMIAVKAEQKELELVFEIDRAMPVEYYGDDVRIRQVLVNLLTNAIKYTPSGVVKLSASAKTNGDKALLYFEVRDTGIGIKHEDIDKLFSEFERIDTEKNRYIEGTGLGMNITVQLLKLMGSELHVESKYGEGSVFYFEPMQDVVNADPIGDFRERLTQASEPEQHEKYIAPKANILVVDDNMMNRKVFKGLLKPTQMQIVEAATEEDVVELPEIEGFDFEYAIRMLGSKEILKSTLIDFYHSIAQTTQKFKELEVKLMTDTGADCYRIEIHALKGVSATVGAIGLSSLAKLLETAAKGKNLDRIFTLHPIFMEEFEKHEQRLKKVFGEKPEDESPAVEEDKLEPLNKEEIVQMFGMLSDVLSMGDYGTASIVLYEITKYKYNKEVQTLIDALEAQIREYNSEAAIDGITEILKHI